LLKKILTGDFEKIPDLTPSLIRIFLSSTFTGLNYTYDQNNIFGFIPRKYHFNILDFYDERDYIIKEIYPILKKWCSEKYQKKISVRIFIDFFI
jgi:hypothetical protein